MSDIEDIREAARLMRERALAATPGPWREWPVDPRPRRQVGPWKADPVAEVYERGESPANAEHIASWHPAVALAVADWLDYTADTWLDPLPAGAVWGDQEQALTVARAFLGGAR